MVFSTATQVLMLGQLIPDSCWVVPEDRLIQVAPPLLVAAMVPPVPTAKQVPLLGQLMARVAVVMTGVLVAVAVGEEVAVGVLVRVSVGV